MFGQLLGDEEEEEEEEENGDANEEDEEPVGHFCRQPMTRGQYYKTFYVRNLRIFIISWSGCPLQAFATKSIF